MEPILSIPAGWYRNLGIVGYERRPRLRQDLDIAEHNAFRVGHREAFLRGDADVVERDPLNRHLLQPGDLPGAGGAASRNVADVYVAEDGRAGADGKKVGGLVRALIEGDD